MNVSDNPRLAAEPAPERASYVLHFLIEDIRVCADLDNVLQVLPLVELQAVPGAPDFLVGLMSLRGETVPVIDLAERLNLRRSRPYGLDTPVLLCVAGERSAGVVVDQVLGVESFSETDKSMEEPFRRANPPFLAAVTLKGGLALLADFDRLLQIDLSGGTLDPPEDPEPLSRRGTAQ